MIVHFNIFNCDRTIVFVFSVISFVFIVGHTYVLYRCFRIVCHIGDFSLLDLIDDLIKQIEFYGN